MLNIGFPGNGILCQVCHCGFCTRCWIFFKFIIVLATKAVLSKNRYKEREIKEQVPRITDKGMPGPSEYFLWLLWLFKSQPINHCIELPHKKSTEMTTQENYKLQKFVEIRRIIGKEKIKEKRDIAIFYTAAHIVCVLHIVAKVINRYDL